METFKSVVFKKNNLRKALVMTLLLFCSYSITPALANKMELVSDTSKTKMRGEHGLTPAQKTKIKELKMQVRKEMLSLNNQIKEKQARLQTLETGDKTDIATINATIDEIQSLKTKIMKLKAANKQDIRKILNPEQRLDFDMRSTHGKKERHGKGHRNHH